MQTSTQSRPSLKAVRSPGIRDKRGRAQRRPGKRTNGDDKSRDAKQPCIVRAIQQSRDTRVFNSASLRFDIKLGSQILRQAGISVDYAFENKRTALLLYHTLKHMPEYENKQYSNINEAIYHIFSQLYKVIRQRAWYFKEIDDWGYDDKIPEEYTLVIVNEDYDVGCNAIWSSFKGMFKNVRYKPKERKILLMAMKYLIYNIGFSIFENEGSEGIPSMEDWYQMELDNALQGLESEIHAENPVAEDIKNAEKYVASVKATYIDYDKHCGKIVNKIRNTKTDIKWFKRAVKSLLPSDFKMWAEHIHFLVDKGFNVVDYAPSGYDTKPGNSGINEDMTSSVSAYGFVYDGDDEYCTHINRYWNDYANNVGVVPFMDYIEIHPTRGIIRECTYEPVLSYIEKIFKFDLQTFTYESN